jgi:hypothetical protein
MVNGYIDDSADHKTFVLAGYVAPADEWVRFSEAWQEALDGPPSVTHLKTVDAMSPKPVGVFHGWTRAAVDQKLEQLYSIIDAHVSYEVSAVVVLADLEKVFGDAPLPKRAKDPFYLAISSLISGVARLQVQQEQPTDEVVDWVFDETVKKQGRFIAVWDMLKATAPMDIRHMIGGTPAFRKDFDKAYPARSVLPLQAADMEAWWLRRRWQEKLQGLDRLEYPWQPAQIPCGTSILDEPALVTARDATIRAFAAIGYDHATGTVDAAHQAALGLDD